MAIYHSRSKKKARILGRSDDDGSSAVVESRATLTEPFSSAKSPPAGKAEAHKEYSFSGDLYSVQVLDHLWDFVTNEQSGVLRFATDSGTTAVHDGTDFVSSGTPTFGDDGFIVIEPVDPYPGGGRWQIKIWVTDADHGSMSKLKTLVSWSGGWTVAEDHFDSVDAKSTEYYASDYNLTLAAEDALLISCSNADTYTGSDGETQENYTYLRLLVDDSNEADTYENYTGFYVGGYIPVDANDTKPVCLFRGDADPVDSGVRWGTNANHNGSCPGELDHSSTTNIAGFRPKSTANFAAPNSRSGNAVNSDVVIVDHTDKVTLGSWGYFTALLGDSLETASDRSFGSAWGSHSEYINTSGFCIRWKP